MATKWKMIRVSEETHRLLQEVRESYERAREQGQIDLAQDYRHEQVSFDTVIRRLIQERQAHAERRKQHRRRRNGENNQGQG